jgi:hydrogenase maturation protease
MMIIGFGNEFRHDDAVGLIAVRELREQGVPAQEAAADPAILMDRWTGADAVVLVDAVSSGAAPGTIHFIDASVSARFTDFFKGSTHAIGLADAIELSRVLGTLPPRVHIFGVEGKDFAQGVGLSREVECALPALIERIKLCINIPLLADEGWAGHK